MGLRDISMCILGSIYVISSTVCWHFRPLQGLGLLTLAASWATGWTGGNTISANLKLSAGDVDPIKGFTSQTTKTKAVNTLKSVIFLYFRADSERTKAGHIASGHGKLFFYLAVFRRSRTQSHMYFKANLQAQSHLLWTGKIDRSDTWASCPIGHPVSPSSRSCHAMMPGYRVHRQQQ